MTALIGFQRHEPLQQGNYTTLTILCICMMAACRGEELMYNDLLSLFPYSKASTARRRGIDSISPS